MEKSALLTDAAGALVFVALPCGDIASDLGSADDTAGGIGHRGDGERDVDGRAVFGATHGFVVIDVLSAAEAFENGGLFAVAVPGDDEGDVPADRFRGGEAEKTLGAAIPTGDEAVDGLADDGIVGGFDDGGEQCFRPQAGDLGLSR